MGQLIHTSDRTFAPSLEAPKATVLANVDGNVSKTYINTKTGSYYKINCAEKA